VRRLARGFGERQRQGAGRAEGSHRGNIRVARSAPVGRDRPGDELEEGTEPGDHDPPIGQPGEKLLTRSET
jgi:hypothetical protein